MNKTSLLRHLSLSFVALLLASQSLAIERVSESSSEEQANSGSDGPSLSANGRYVAFSSTASNLVAGDTNGKDDIFVHDRQTGLTERVSVSSSGEQGNQRSVFPRLSAEGRYVAFFSFANNLVAGDTNGEDDIFVHDRQTGQTERVSMSSNGVQGNSHSGFPSLSADGRYVAFRSDASNLVDGDTNGSTDAFVHDRQTRLTERVSVSSSGEQGNSLSGVPSLSADGRYVVFDTYASNLSVGGDNNRTKDVFVHDRQTRLTEQVNVSSFGQRGNGIAETPSLSADGRYVAFQSLATNLVVGDTNNHYDIFVHDRQTGRTERVSISTNGMQGNLKSLYPRLSADGNQVIFHSNASNLVPGDTNDVYDVFVHDRQTGWTKRMSVSSSGEQANGESLYGLSLSADGRHVAFHSVANNLTVDDTNNSQDVFVVDRDDSQFDSSLYALSAQLRSTSGAVAVGEYIRFRAVLTNTSDQQLNNCQVKIINQINPILGYGKLFSYSSWPLKVANPVKNGSIDIAPGETGQFNLAVLPRVAIRREVRFEYICDNTKALPIPFINSVHLTAKTEPLIAEDFVQLKNSNKRTDLIIDRSNGKYWTGYVVKASNTGSEPTRVNLTTISDFPDAILRQSRLCEPMDPANSNWTCMNPRDTQLQVDLDPGETKKILVYVHARASIDNQPVSNRIYIEAHDGAGEVVAKTSMGISTIN